jgi:hypothetical protein
MVTIVLQEVGKAGGGTWQRIGAFASDLNTASTDDPVIRELPGGPIDFPLEEQPLEQAVNAMLDFARTELVDELRRRRGLS